MKSIHLFPFLAEGSIVFTKTGLNECKGNRFVSFGFNNIYTNKFGRKREARIQMLEQMLVDNEFRKLKRTISRKKAFE